MLGNNLCLSETAIREYMKIYKEEYGQEITFDKAKIEALDFLEFIKLILSNKK